MKSLFAVFWLLLLNEAIAFSQARTIRVSAGNDVAQTYSPNGFYRFPRFAKALLYYKGGRQNSGQQFNYNFLSGSLQFIGPKGDTMELAGAESLDSVVFDANIFLVHDGLMEMIATTDSIVLLKKITIKWQTESMGAYGMPNPTSSIEHIKSFSNGVGVYNLILNQDVVLTETTSWFFAAKNGSLVTASKSNLLKLLATDKQARTENYLKQNKTSFEKENDLKKLMAAIGG